MEKEGEGFKLLMESKNKDLKNEMSTDQDTSLESITGENNRIIVQATSLRE